MILVINATNRPGNKSQIISKYCYDLLLSLDKEEVKYLSLESLTADMFSPTMYDAPGQSPALSEIQDSLIIPSSKWLMIVPEYNGSFPGILKTMVDALSVRRFKETFEGRAIGLIGVSDGKAGNLRGMEHLTGVFNYLKMDVYHNKLPISSISTVLYHGEIVESTQLILDAYLHDFIAWPKNKYQV